MRSLARRKSGMLSCASLARRKSGMLSCASVAQARQPNGYLKAAVDTRDALFGGQRK